MREMIQRCKHCGVEYVYQASGHGCGNPLNDGKLCPVCKGVVCDALRGVPRRFEERYQDTHEVPRFAALTIDQVLAWERANDADTRARQQVEPSFPMVRRIWPGLFNLESGDHKTYRQVRGRETFRDVLFQVATWDKSAADYSIKVPMEWDLLEGRFTGQMWR